MRTVNRIAPAVTLSLESDGRYLIETADGKKARLQAPALAPLLLVDGWRSEEEIGHRMAQNGAPLPAGTLGQIFGAMRLAGVLEQTQTHWRPLATRDWPEHRCQGCGACCQGHWIGPLEPDFIALTTPRMEELREKYPNLRGRKPFVRISQGDPALYLNSESGQCVFLGDDLRCILHREYGAESKPTICRQFPHVRLEDEVQTRLGVGLSCLRHNDQILDADQAADDSYWQNVQDELDGALFHFYPADEQLELEEQFLSALPRSERPLSLALETLATGRAKVSRLGAAGELDRLVRKHLKRVEAALADDDLMTGLAQRPGLLPKRIADIRGVCLEKPPKGRPVGRVASAKTATPGIRNVINDNLVRFVFLRQYLMFYTMAHALAGLCLGIWVSLLLSSRAERPECCFGEVLATWIRVLQAPAVRRQFFEKPEEVTQFLSAFQRFWNK